MQSETLCACLSTCIACICSRRRCLREVANASVSVLAEPPQHKKLHQLCKCVWHSLQMCCLTRIECRVLQRTGSVKKLLMSRHGAWRILLQVVACCYDTDKIAKQCTHQSCWTHRPTVCKKAWKAVTASASVAKPPVKPTSTRSHANH